MKIVKQAFAPVKKNTIRVIINDCDNNRIVFEMPYKSKIGSQIAASCVCEE
jgi:hypothetical protein